MGAIFVVPTLISESVPERMVPMIGKLIERNIAVNYRNIFREAADISLRSDHLLRFRKEDEDLLEARGTKGRGDLGKQNPSGGGRGQQYNEPRQRDPDELQKQKNKLDAEIAEINARAALHANAIKDPYEKGQYINKMNAEINKLSAEIDGINDRIRSPKEKELDILKKMADISSVIDRTRGDIERQLDVDIKRGLIDKQDAEALKNRAEVEKYKSEVEKNRDKEDRKARLDQMAAQTGRSKAEIKKIEAELKELKKKPKVKDVERGAAFTDLDKIQVPHGITFYTNITFEPTLVEFMVDDVIVTIGIKCIPYHFSDMENVLTSILKYGQKGLIPGTMRFLSSKWNTIKKKIIPFTKAKNIYHGRPVSVGFKAWRLSPNVDDPGVSPMDDILYSPDYKDLLNARYIARNMSGVSSASSWSTVLVLTVEDIEKSGLDLEYFYRSYKRLVKSGWGDIIIVDTNNEQVSYCSIAMMSCANMQFSYLRKLMDLENVLDFTELSKFARGPFSKVPMKTFIKGFNKNE